MLSSALEFKLKLEQEKRKGAANRSPFAWAAYIDDNPGRWIQANFYIPETNGPMELYPFHQAGLREALAIDGGLFRYSTVVWSAIKKSIKSTIAAAVAIWMAWQKPWSSIKIIANHLNQADDRAYYYIRRCLELNAGMRPLVKVVGYKMFYPNHSTIEAIPIDPK